MCKSVLDPVDVSILAVIYRNFTLPTLLKLDWFKGQSDMKSWYLHVLPPIEGFPATFLFHDPGCPIFDVAFKAIPATPAIVATNQLYREGFLRKNGHTSCCGSGQLTDLAIHNVQDYQTQDYTTTILIHIDTY